MDEDLLHLVRTWEETTNEGIAMSNLIPLQDLPAIEKEGGGICVYYSVTIPWHYFKDRKSEPAIC